MAGITTTLQATMDTATIKGILKQPGTEMLREKAVKLAEEILNYFMEKMDNRTATSTDLTLCVRLLPLVGFDWKEATANGGKGGNE